MGSKILLIYKPKGIPSRKAMLAVTHRQKAGLEGILDPFADGLLIAATNTATRFLQYFLELDKVYEASLRLGIETDTLDLSGRVVKNMKPPLLKKQDIEKVLARFRGRIKQKPPVYSNIKIKGVPVRKLIRSASVRSPARGTAENMNIELDSREVMVHDTRLIDFCDGLIRFKVSVGSGTYIRSLGRDIASALGTVGHLEALTRTSIGKFSIEEVLSGEAIQIKENEKPLTLYAKTISISEALYWLPQIPLQREQIISLYNGQGLTIEGQTDEKNIFKIIDPHKKFCGLASVENGRLVPRKMLPVLPSID